MFGILDPSDAFFRGKNERGRIETPLRMKIQLVKSVGLVKCDNIAYVAF